MKRLHLKLALIAFTSGMAGNLAFGPKSLQQKVNASTSYECSQKMVHKHLISKAKIFRRGSI